jgi:hypothetical protein
MSTDKDSKTRTASEALAEVQAEAPDSSESKKARQQEEKSDADDDDSDDAKDEDYEDEEEDEAAVAKDIAEEAYVASVLQAEQEAKLTKQAEQETKLTNGSRLGDLVKCHPEAMQKVMLLQMPNKHCEDLDTAEAWMFSVKELKEVFGITLDQFYRAGEEQLAKWFFKDDEDFRTAEEWTEHEEFMAQHNTSTDFYMGQGDGEVMLALRTVTLNA